MVTLDYRKSMLYENSLPHYLILAYNCNVNDKKKESARDIEFAPLVSSAPLYKKGAIQQIVI
jgi:hypothetical protein